MSSKLYGIHIESSDEIYAAPSLQVAQIMKEKHDQAMKLMFEAEKKNGALWTTWATLDCLLADIIEIEPKEHAELMTEFSYPEWKISEQDLIAHSQNDQQCNLFAEGSEA